VTRTPEPLLSIQYLRAVAALMVLGYHACRWAGRDFGIGAAGVDVFFVISGFILWTIAAQWPASPGQFLARRLGRVAPLYWILTLGVTAAALAWPDFFFDVAPEPLHVVLSLVFIPHLNPAGAPFPLISAGWSLNYETGFYLLFAASLAAPAASRFRWLACGLCGVVLFGLVVRPAYFLGANLMFMQFLAGVWLARRRLVTGLPGRQVGWRLVVAAIGLFAGLAFLDLFEAILRPLWWGVPAFALVAGLVMVEDDGGLPNWPWLRLLGDASYSIYLTHVLVTESLSHLMDTTAAPYLPIAVAGSLAVGVVCHFVLEKPLLALFRKRPRAALPSVAI
jgi:exopolysaccharide production protein ExoZ